MCFSAISTACSIPASQSQRCEHLRLSTFPWSHHTDRETVLMPTLLSHTLASRPTNRTAGFVYVAAAKLGANHFSQGVQCEEHQSEQVISCMPFQVCFFSSFLATRHRRLTTPVLPASTRHQNSLTLHTPRKQTFRAYTLVYVGCAHLSSTPPAPLFKSSKTASLAPLACVHRAQNARSSSKSQNIPIALRCPRSC